MPNDAARIDERMTHVSKSSRKWLILTLKLALLGLLVWGVRRTLGDAFEKLGEHPPRLEPLWLVASGVLYLVAMLPSVLFWQRVLRVLGQEAGLLKTARAYYIGHLGKYVPGKANSWSSCGPE